MNCSIIIRAYNEEKHIGRLLEGIKHQTRQRCGSDPRGLRLDRLRLFPLLNPIGAQIVHIRPEEFTFGRSLNYGIKAAKREFIVIASAHVYPVYPDWLETLLRPFQDDSVALTYGKQRGPDFAKFSEQQIFHQWYPDASKPKQETAFCNNANAAIRKSLWEKNNYDETLTGLEDLAWAKWAKEQGHAIAYVAEAEIIHVHNETPRGVYNRYRREAMASAENLPRSAFQFLRFPAPDHNQYFERPLACCARTCAVEKYLLHFLVSLHAISRHAHGTSRDQSRHPAIARDVLLCKGKKEERWKEEGCGADSV